MKFRNNSLKGNFVIQLNVRLKNRKKFFFGVVMMIFDVVVKFLSRNDFEIIELLFFSVLIVTEDSCAIIASMSRL